MQTSEKILQLIDQRTEATPNELASQLAVSKRAVFKQLSKLLDSGKLAKTGKPPKVFYRINTQTNPEFSKIELKPQLKKTIEENFLYITPIGEYYPGLRGFAQWCHERKLNIHNQAKQYHQLLQEIYASRKDGLLDATNKFGNSFDQNYLKKVFYIDFYSVPQFGKTKLGQLLLYAKQSQDRKRIKEVSEMSKEHIVRVIKKHKIDAVGFIPPTVKRETQFIKELERNLNLNLPTIAISKIKTDIIVPQKTLNKLSDRITNAGNTFVVEEKRQFKNILLIDDAVGSGATFNEIARKIVGKNVAKNVYGLAITGSFKGFDVISEV